jgi:hypothetical protein
MRTQRKITPLCTLSKLKSKKEMWENYIMSSTKIKKCLRHIFEMIKASRKRLLPNFTISFMRDYRETKIPKRYNGISTADLILNHYSDLYWNKIIINYKSIISITRKVFWTNYTSRTSFTFLLTLIWRFLACIHSIHSCIQRTIVVINFVPQARSI